MQNIYSYLTPVDFAIVAAYLLILIFIGYWVSFVKEKKKDENGGTQLTPRSEKSENW